jgi:hypothetical protein
LQALAAGAAQQSEEKKLNLVVGVMRHSNHARFETPGATDQKLVPQPARRHFQ